MQWWAWIAVGAILLGSELGFIDAQFYLLFVGASAVVVGFLDLAGLLPYLWMQWAIFGVLSVVSVVVFRRRIYSRLRKNLPDMKHGPVGDTVVLPAQLQPGETCRLEYCGGSWSAINGGASLISAGQRARIDGVNGLTLVVHGESL
jgi:membrane protein implicated in regulation of membrane protease activity